MKGRTHFVKTRISLSCNVFNAINTTFNQPVIFYHKLPRHSKENTWTNMEMRERNWCPQIDYRKLIFPPISRLGMGSLKVNEIVLDGLGTYLANRSLGVSFMSSSRTCFITLRGQSFLLDRSVIPCQCKKR